MGATVRYFSDPCGTVPAKPGDVALVMRGPSGFWFRADGIGVIGEDGVLIDGCERGEWTPARLIERARFVHPDDGMCHDDRDFQGRSPERRANDERIACWLAVIGLALVAAILIYAGVRA